MEVTPSLPRLVVPSGSTPHHRKRHNDLDEVEDELLRIQIRQHFSQATVSTERVRRSKRDSVSSESALLGGYEAFDVSALMASPRTRFADVWHVIKRLLYVSDDDMSEEINERDPKIVAGKQFLQGVEAFSMLSENELAQLVALAELRCYKGGEVVVPDERTVDGLYIVLSGTAARFPLPDENGPSPDDFATEHFAYQDHFGSLISPTEAAQTERSEAAVVATSDELECIWIPELAVRVLNVQPRMEHEFALVLHNHRNMDAADEIVERLLRAGVHVTVLANTRATTAYIVLLLSAPLALLAREDKLLTMERIVEHQSAEDAAILEDESYDARAETLSASDRIAAFAALLTRSTTDKPPGAGLRGIERNDDAVIKDVFPLHDPSMTDFILSTWCKETTTATAKRLFLLRVKDYFGLRVAFYMAFVRLYNAALVYPANVGCLLWLVWRWIDYRSYVQALGLYGLLIAFIWAPSFVKRWLRYQNSLLVEWNLLGSREVAISNRQFRDYIVETVNVAGPHEPPDLVEVKTYDPRRRWPKYVIFSFFCILSLALLFIFVGVYVQWYIIAVMTPMCTDPRCPQYLDVPGGCEAHCHELFALGKTHLFMQHIASCSTYCNPTTFDRAYYACDAPLVGCFATERGIVGTARWFYVLVQGIVLGLTLDIVFLALFEAIAAAFNTWENYATEQEQETRLIEKIFLFNWVGYFYWFFLLAFVYVPNGAHVQAFIREHIDQSWVVTMLQADTRFSRYWIDGLISMDAAFVTPMIVTQALNLVINTFVPYLLRRAIVRARDSYHIKKDQFTTALKKRPLRVVDERPSLTSEASGILNPVVDDDLESPWLAPSDMAALDRRELAQQLAQRAPVKAETLESAVQALFRNVVAHDSHMQTICGTLDPTDLDSHQRTSYDWLDRMTRTLEGRKGVLGDGRLQFVTQWQCRHYLYTADRILEESSMPIYSPASDLLHLAIQFSYTIMFSVVWPFCCLCSCVRNAVALRFDAIKMTIDCKRPIPRRTIGVGDAWLGALLFEILVAQVVVPALFVYVSGQLDAFYRGCELKVSRYGPAVNAGDPACGLGGGARLQAFVTLENIGLALLFVLYLKKSEMSHETAIKVLEHARKLKHHVRKSVRVIGETILVGVTRRVVVGASPEKASTIRRGDSMLLPIDDEASTVPTTSTDGFYAIDLRDKPSVAVHPLVGSLHRRRTQGVLEIAQTKAALDGTPPRPSSESPASTLAVVEWREGTVAWIRSGRLKVNYRGGRQLSATTGSATPSLPYNESEVWLAPHETYVVMEPTPVQIFEVEMPVLLASKTFGRWTEATIVALDKHDRFGKELVPTPNQMHVKFIEGQNLRTHGVRQATLMDPYCVLTVNGVRDVRHTTSVKRSTLNPVWDESVVFPLSERELYGISSNRTTKERPFAPGTTSSSGSVIPSAAVSASSSRSASRVVMDRDATGTHATLLAAAAAFHLPNIVPQPPTSVVTHSMTVPRRTLKISVLNNDAFATGECVGEVEIDLDQFRDGVRHRVLVPLSKKRHVWTLDAIQSVMRKQAMGGVHYPMLGLPHLLVELQWIDTRLPTKVTVRVKGQPPGHDLVLSRKFCETNLCYGVDPSRIVHAGAH